MKKIYKSKSTGTYYPLTQAGDRIDLQHPIKEESVDLPNFKQIGENNTFIIFELHTPTWNKQGRVLGNMAARFYAARPKSAGQLQSIFDSSPINHVYGYFKAPNNWIAFDNTDGTWKEEEMEEEALCIEWLKN